MLRQIVIPKEKNYTLQLPDAFLGKKIELIAFELENDAIETEALSRDERLKNVQSIFADCRVDLTNFKFNRDQANQYDA